MKIMLIADVKKVGQRGAVVTVADGYAQNVLLPKKLAIPATPENVKRIEAEHALAADKKAMQMIMAGKAIEALDGKTITIKAKANEKGGLFEAVQTKHVHDAILKQLSADIPISDIMLEEPIKKTGSHAVTIAGKSNAVITVTISSE
jgi:large subunit ribosomal protein L9